MTSFQEIRRGYDLRVEEHYNPPKMAKKDTLDEKNAVVQHKKDDRERQGAVIDTQIKMDVEFDKTVYEQQTQAWAERMHKERLAREEYQLQQEQMKYFWSPDKVMTDAEKEYENTKIYAHINDFRLSW